MGGIIGKLSFNRDEALARPLLEQMLAAVRYRGSVAGSFYTAPGLALGWCDDPAAPSYDSMQATREIRAVHVAADSSLTNARQLHGRGVVSYSGGPAAALVPGLLLGPRLDGRGIVSRLALRRLWEEHSSGRRDHSRGLWSLVMLELWFRRFADGDAAEEPLEYALLRAA